MKIITIHKAVLVMAVAFVAMAHLPNASAHPSRAQFRLDELTTMKAKITRVSNPHVFYGGMVTNDKGVAEDASAAIDEPRSQA